MRLILWKVQPTRCLMRLAISVNKKYNKKIGHDSYPRLNSLGYRLLKTNGQLSTNS